eukprot:CAMPEP_0204197896 /NCGR_PEP_ID=MMETSP0361-20130328/64887_1 /ASSEMBLY_ACC=CAM_ASM_000343 /TAXON_ID=268821 /ORGANISM="Scrippsiella Hangoei, Strain SHTV-5" /LENGTH=89 /DNA_ID=CAMNT_0051159905 /DNA_START=16 /DNA_END=281 /DNA_ORIENTATION=-
MKPPRTAATGPARRSAMGCSACHVPASGSNTSTKLKHCEPLKPPTQRAQLAPYLGPSAPGKTAATVWHNDLEAARRALVPAKPAAAISS